MKRESLMYSLLPYSLIIVFISGMTVETAWVRKSQDNKDNDIKHTNKILKRDTPNEMHEDHIQKQYKPEIPTKRSTSEDGKVNINTKLNRRDLMEELEKIKERFSTQLPQPHQVQESESRGPSYSYIRVTNSPTSFYEKLSYSTKRYSSSIGDFENSSPNHLIPIKQEMTNIPQGESKLLRNKMNKNINYNNNAETRVNIQRSDQRPQIAHPPESRIFAQDDDEVGNSKDGDSDGDRKSGRKSINEVYGLAVKAERKYEESTEKCGRVKFSEMSAELMSEMERSDRVGNVKFEDSMPDGKDCLKNWPCMSTTRHSRDASESKAAAGSKSGTAPASNPLPKPLVSKVTGEKSSGLQAKLLRRAEGVNQLTKRSGEGVDNGGEVDVDEDDALDDGDTAFQDVAVPLIGNRRSALGRPSID